MEHKLIRGGHQWLPFARSRIRALLATGLSYASQMFELPDGVRCSVSIVPGQEFIRIDGGSMLLESGGINVGLHSLYDLYEVDTCALYQGDYARSLYLQDGRIKEKLPAQRPSEVYARPDPIPPMDPDPYVYLGPYDGSEGGGPRSTALLELRSKKQALISTLATRYTGKMRLFVQAILGSDPLRISVDGQGAWLDAVYQMGTNTCIHADEHGEYWMMRIGDGYRDAMRMNFGALGTPIQRKLHKRTDRDAADWVAEEAYMFSRLGKVKPNLNTDTDSSLRALFVGTNIDYTEPEGFVLAYGWHHGHDNRKATKVIHRTDPNVVQDELASPANISAVFTMTFTSAAIKGDPPTIAISNEGFHSYRVTYQESTMYGVANGTNFPWYWQRVGAATPCEAPLYSFYRRDDTRAVFWFKRVVSGGVLPEDLPYPVVSGLGVEKNESEGFTRVYTVTARCEIDGGIAWEINATGKDDLSGVKQTVTVVTESSLDLTLGLGAFDTNLGAYAYGVYAVPAGMAGAPAPTWNPGHYTAFNAVEKGALMTYETANKSGFVYAGVIFMPSSIDPDCFYCGIRKLRRQWNSISTNTQETLWHISYEGGDSMVPDWAFDCYNSPDFGPWAGPWDTVFSTSEDGEDKVKVMCVTRHHNYEITDVWGGAAESDWAEVFMPWAGFERSYMTMESYGGASHILAIYNPTTFTLLDGAVQDAHLFIGYS